MTADNRSRARLRTVFFGSDRMRHDLMERYAAAGEMPVPGGPIASLVAGNR
jgi:hypothetical protein